MTGDGQGSTADSTETTYVEVKSSFSELDFGDADAQKRHTKTRNQVASL